MHHHGHGPHGPGFGPGYAQGGYGPQGGHGPQGGQVVQEGQGVIICSAVNPNLCLDVNEGSTKDRARIILFDYSGNDNQLWVREGNALISKKSGKALDIEGGEGEGKNIIQFSKNNGANQQFKITVGNSSGVVYITSPSGLALTVKNNNIAKREEIVVSKLTGAHNQLWVLKYA